MQRESVCLNLHSCLAYKMKTLHILERNDIHRDSVCLNLHSCLAYKMKTLHILETISTETLCA